MLIEVTNAIPALLFFLVLLELLSLSLQIKQQDPLRLALSGGQRLPVRNARQLLHDLLRARNEIDQLIGALK